MLKDLLAFERVVDKMMGYFGLALPIEKTTYPGPTPPIPIKATLANPREPYIRAERLYKVLYEQKVGVPETQEILDRIDNYAADTIINAFRERKSESIRKMAAGVGYAAGRLMDRKESYLKEAAYTLSGLHSTLSHFARAVKLYLE